SQQLRVAVLDRLVGGTGEEVEGAHGMAFDGDGLAHRDVGGEVSGPGGGAGEALLATADVEEEPGEVLDVLPAGETEQLHQRHLDDGVAPGRGPAAGTEDRLQVV